MPQNRMYSMKLFGTECRDLGSIILYRFIDAISYPSVFIHIQPKTKTNITKIKISFTAQPELSMSITCIFNHHSIRLKD